MIKSLALVAFALAFVDANVIELKDADFDSKLEDLDAALVMFYAPWCGHCKRLKPDFEKASVDLLKHDPPVQLAKVDCTEAGKDTCSRFSVSGYPTLKIFKGGEFSAEYNGPRHADGIVKHMRTQVGPASKELDSDADMEKRLEEAADVVVAGVFEDEDDLDVFLKTADKMREEVSFVHSKKSSKVRKAGVRLLRPKHLRTKLEEAEVKYDGDMDKNALSKWIKKTYHGLAGHRTVDNAKDFSGPVVVAYYDVDYKKNPKGTNYWRNRVIKVAKNFPAFKFAVSNIDDFRDELREFGWDHVSGDKPVVTLKNEKGLKYKMEDYFDVEALTKFLEDYEAGKLEVYVKSEPLPESNDAGVKVAVGKNFQELVTESKKDVLIEFYAPWCGHCKKLAPIYDELGEKMLKEDVEIVKMDATANDVPPEFDVRGFPTLYWVKKGEAPESYNGGRELDDFVKYVAKHATNELKGFDRNGNPKKTEL